MKLTVTRLLALFCAFVFALPLTFAQDTSTRSQRRCQTDARVSVAFTGDTLITTCTSDDVNSLVRFQVELFAQAFAYVTVNEEGRIARIGYSNFINFDMLPAGEYRVYAFSIYGRIAAREGDVFEGARLATICFGLTDNFVTVINGAAGPDDVSIATADGATSYTFCPDDGIADLITVTAGDTDGAVFLITNENGTVLAVNETGTIDFDEAGLGTCRVYAYANARTLRPGASISSVDNDSDCGGGLSANFITVVREEVAGGSISSGSGTEDIVVCTPSTATTVVDLSVTGNTGDNYVYFLANADSIVTNVLSGSRAEITARMAADTRWIIGAAYTGDLIAVPGDFILDTRVATGCFDFSDNFIRVRFREAEGGTVTTADGSTNLTFCVEDENTTNEVSVVLRGGSEAGTAFVVTDGNGDILFVTTDATATVRGGVPGVAIVRIYGLSFAGELADDLSGNVNDAVFATDCYALSDNFITVENVLPVAGTVTLTDGTTDTTVLVGDGTADVLTFAVSGNSDNSFTFVVTDEEGNVLSIPTGNTQDFDAAPVGVCRVYGLSYTGTLTLSERDNIGEATFSDECSALSENFVTVIRQDLSAGTIALSDGSTSATTCPGDGVDDILEVVSTGATGEGQFGLVVTREDGTILSFPPGLGINFENIDPGVCLIYGFIYTGSITAQQGDVLGEVALTDGFSALTENFITVTRVEATVSPVALRAGGESILLCPGDPGNDIVRLAAASTSLDRFAYLLTDENNVISRVIFTDSLQFQNVPDGVCRIYGLGYSGNLLAPLGRVVGEDQLATQCAALSPNFITVTKENPDGGTVSIAGGGDSTTVCPMDGVPDVVELSVTGNNGAQFGYLITTETGLVSRFTTDTSVDFDMAAEGVSRIYGISYQGTITAAIGDTITDQLATGCFDLSDNFITVIREAVMGGTITADGGQTELTTCPGDGTPDLITFTLTDNSGPNTLLIITDDTGEILNVTAGPEVDFDGAGTGNCRVYGLTFAGALQVGRGDAITADRLAEGCFELTENFVTVVRLQPEGDVISFDGELTATDTLDFCSNDSLTVDVGGGAAGNYDIAVIGNDTLLGYLGRDSFDLQTLVSGTYQLRGVAFIGTLTGPAGGDFNATIAAETCTDLSDNTLVLNLTGVNAGTVTLNGLEVLYRCPDTPDDDLAVLASTTPTTENYAYAITTVTDVILGVTEEAEFDFGSIPVQELRVYGISYTGDLLARIGLPITAPLATGCFDVSDNFAETLNFRPAAGTISVPAAGPRSVSCLADGEIDIEVTVTDNSRAGYAILVTDTEGIIEIVSEDPTAVPFNALDQGSYLLYGLSYTGMLLVEPGDDIDLAVLASSCFELTLDSILLQQGGSIEAGTIGVPGAPEQDSVLICTTSGVPQLALVESTVTGINYRFAITDEEGEIVVPNLQAGIISFSPLAVGTYRIYGYNFNGRPSAFFGQNIETSPLSDSCYAVTSNFITVVKSDTCSFGITDVVDTGGANEDGNGRNPMGSVRMQAAPNPVAGTTLRLELTNEDGPLADGQITIRDFRGQPYDLQELSADNQSTVALTFDISALPSGIYLLHYRSALGQRSIRFIRQ